MSKKSIIIILLVLAVGATGFYFIVTSKSTAHLKLIPQEASFVMKFDNKKIYSKAGFTGERLKQYIKDIREEMEDALPEGVDNVLKKMADDPGSVGIDLVSDVYFFYQGGKREELMGWTFAIKDKKDFHDTLEELFEDEDDMDFDENENFSLAVNENYGGYTAIGWDDEKAVVLVSEENYSYSYYKNYEKRDKNSDDAEEKVEELFSLTKESSILSKPSFDKFLSEAKDISFWVSSDAIKAGGSNDLDELEEELGIDLDDAAFIASLDFRDDKVIARGTLIPNEEMKAKQKKANVLGEGVPAVLLQNLPEKSYATFSMSLNPDAVYTQITEEGAFEEIKREFKRDAGMSMKKFFEGVGGNLIGTVYDFKKHTVTKQVYKDTYDPYGWGYGEYVEEEAEETLPSFALLFDVRNNDIFEDLIEPELDEKKGDYYQMKAEGMKIFVSTRDNIVAVSNDEDYIENFSDAKVTENFSKNDLSSQVKESSCFFHANLDYQSYPDEVKDLLEEEMPSYEVKTFKRIIKYFNHFQARSLDANNFEMSLGIKNETGDNSLKLLFDEISDMLD